MGLLMTFHVSVEWKQPFIYPTSVAKRLMGMAKESNPAFARTRDCMNEFTGCTKWSSMFRKSLLDIDHLMYSRYFSTVVKMSNAIKVRDEEGTYGFRSIEPSKASYLLQEINFNLQIPFQ